MPQPISWTNCLDVLLCEARARGDTWDAISCLMGLSRNSVLSRARRLGLCRSRVDGHLTGSRGGGALLFPGDARTRGPRGGENKAPADHLAAAWIAANRPPLPPGDPLAWSILTDGTLLEGSIFHWRSLDDLARRETPSAERLDGRPERSPGEPMEAPR